MTENQIEFGAHATIIFNSGHDEDEREHYIHIHSGYELFEKLRLYFEKNYKELLGEDAFDVELIAINYHAKNDFMNFELTIGDDDAAQGLIRLKPNVLQDKNIKKLALLREIINYDAETECGSLKALMKERGIHF